MTATPLAAFDPGIRGGLPVTAVPSPVQRRSDRGLGTRQVRLILFGVLWGIVLTGIEIPSIPYATTAARPLSTLLLYQLLGWSLGGLMLSLALWLSTRDDVRWTRLACLLPLVAVINGSVFVAESLLFRRILGYGAADPMLGQPLPMSSVILYAAWLTLLYGSTAALIYALRRRIDQTTAALQGLSLARERNEAALAEARVSAMVERIEPRFLLEVMDTARRQYVGRVERAEATLNACTEFLRCAMPPLRSGQSTVAAELELAAAYLSLRDCMADRDPEGRIDRRHASARDLDDVPLPPMTLLPILEQLLTRRTDVDRVAIDVSVDDASIAIRIGVAARTRESPAAGDDFDAEWLAALSMRLTRVCGHEASIRCVGGHPDAGPTLHLVVPRRNALQRP